MFQTFTLLLEHVTSILSSVDIAMALIPDRCPGMSTAAPTEELADFSPICAGWARCMLSIYSAAIADIYHVAAYSRLASYNDSKRLDSSIN